MPSISVFTAPKTESSRKLDVIIYINHKGCTQWLHSRKLQTLKVADFTGGGRFPIRRTTIGKLLSYTGMIMA